ncbi:MAG: urease accessory protein UreE [Gammaproteobacteria bacterium]|nr:urease accessory protein UreE [Gammaproteobacteria bacterium]
MIQITVKLTAPATATTTLTLPFELRQKSRLRATLDNGAEAGLFLERGTLLRHGDLLRADSGEIIEVRAAIEDVSTARAADSLLLARACYHLGNRHVPLQVGGGWLRYLHDHVLDDMLLHMGLDVTFERAPFEPEAGAYAEQGQGHIHAHHHDHGH